MLISKPGTARAETRNPAHVELLLGVGEIERLGDPVALQDHTVDRVADHASVTWREDATDCDFGHAERRKHAPGAEPEGCGGGHERLDGLRVDRFGAAERQRQRRQVEVVHPRQRREWPSTHEKFGPAVAVPPQSLIHCIQLPGLARKSCGAA